MGDKIPVNPEELLQEKITFFNNRKEDLEKQLEDVYEYLNTYEKALKILKEQMNY